MELGIPPYLINATVLGVTSATIDVGGDDVILGGTGRDLLIGGANRLGGGDIIDGQDDADLIFGDNASLIHRPANDPVRNADPRMVRLTAEEIYNLDGTANLDLSTRFADPRLGDAPWAEFEVTGLFHDTTYRARNDRQFGNDRIAGGAGNDHIFGQLGDDTILGDGSAQSWIDGTAPIQAHRLADGTLSVTASVEAATDGDDYIEGGEGNDVLFGNRGQDDIVGGSSSLFTLTTPAMRADGSDIIFGGAGLRLGPNAPGTGSEDTDLVADHAGDADMILGDNGNIYVLVDAADRFDGPFLQYAYDSSADIGSNPDDPQQRQSRGELRIIPRAVVKLDYTYGDDAAGLGASDLIYGEDGDDTILGMRGNDVLYGGGWDDNLIGGTGDDRLLGGTGEDGILGDDGIIRTSRNGLAEPLNGIAASTETVLALPGPFIGAVVDLGGYLKKTMDLIEPTLGGADLIHGGLGDDFLHGGAGNDAISGAEALAALHADTRPLAGFFTPDGVRHAGILAYQPTTGILTHFVDPLTGAVAVFYDPDAPRTKIEAMPLNFDAIDENGVLIEDGKDSIFGGEGNDVIVGGTGHDRLFGGWGDDWLQLDDNLDTDGGLNDNADDHRDPARTAGAADFAFGGGGRDVLIANTGADRMFDWTGEYNSFVVPFARFGAPTVNRLPNPQTIAFLIDLATAAGAGTSVARVEAQIAIVRPGDPAWNDQHGAPRDPQPGNGHGTYDSQGGPEDDRLTVPLQTGAGSTPTRSTERGNTRGTPPELVQIDVESAINAVNPLSPTRTEDADAATLAVRVDVGTEFVRTYLVSNPGDVDLTNVQVTDEQDGLTFSPIYVSGDLDGDLRLDVGETWLYTSRGAITLTAAEGLTRSTVTVTASGRGNAQASDSDQTWHIAGDVVQAPSVRLETAINAVDPLNPTAAEDADSGTGPTLAAGSAITWTYLVSNTGPSAVTITSLFDDAGTAGATGDDFAPVYVSGDLDGDNLLDTNETWLYRATGVAGQTGYAGSALVTVADGALQTASSSDTVVYSVDGGTGDLPSVRLETAINAVDPLNPTAAEDADSGTGPTLAAGSAITWTYLVSNTGPSAVTITSLFDDAGTAGAAGDDFAPVYVSGDLDGDNLLDTNETWLYRATGVAGAGAYGATAEIIAVDSAGRTAASRDTVVYSGSVIDVVSIDIEKAVNAVDPLNPTSLEDADTGAGPIFVTGQPMTWTYIVRNTGTVAVSLDKETGVVDDAGTPLDVTDDFSPIYVSGDTDGDGMVDLGEVWLFTSSGVVSATAGTESYVNVATVTATDLRTGNTVSDSDAAHYAVSASGMGKTPGFWKTNAANWEASAWPRQDDGTLVYDPAQRLDSVFDIPDSLSAYAGISLEDALDLNGGGANALLRHAVAALLNATHQAIAYPVSAPEVISMTNEALLGTVTEMNAVKDRFAKWNEFGSDLDQHGRSSSYDLLAATLNSVSTAWLLEPASPIPVLYEVYDPMTDTIVSPQLVSTGAARGKNA